MCHNASPTDATDCLGGSRSSRNTSTAPLGKTTGVLTTISLLPKQFRSFASIPKNPVRQISTMRWGLVTHWAKDASGAAGMINARSETAATKTAFRDPLRYRRCLIPADGFYEWSRTSTNKQPYCFEVNDGELFAFAGLWDGWKDATGNWVKSCSILTTTPNSVTSAVHDRMPVILGMDDYDVWLDPNMNKVSELSKLLVPIRCQVDAELRSEHADQLRRQ